MNRLRSRKIVFSSLIALLLCVAMPAEAAGFSYYHSITVNHLKVPNTDQTNFPVLVNGTFSELKTAANGGRVQNSNGYDIGFYTNSDCTTGKMNWETETYSATTGVVNYWVKIASLSHTADTVFYMCYGNSSITTDQSSPASVWDSNYIGVYHFANGTTLSGTDSTGLNNGTFTGSPPATSGIADGAMSLNGSTQYMSAGSAGIGATAITVEGWVNPASFDVQAFGSSPGVILFDTRNNDTDVSPTLGIADTGTGEKAFFGADSAGLFRGAASVNVASAGTWYFIAGSYDGFSNFFAYFNGVDEGEDNLTLAGSFVGGTFTGSPWRFGYAPQWSPSFSNEKLDEMRISKVQRSDDWIATEYNNQSATSTFYTVGSEVAVPQSAASVHALFSVLGGILRFVGGRVVIK